MEEFDLMRFLRDEVDFVPEPDSPNVVTVQLKNPAKISSARDLTEEEWDKFEADIEEAFEQVPLCASH